MKSQTSHDTPGGGRRISNIGVQLHTVRAEMKRDVEGTIATVAGIGYKEVEFAGYFDRSPADLRSILERNGLTAPAAHIDYKNLALNVQQILDAALRIGHRYIVVPGIDEETRNGPGGWKHLAESFNRTGETCKKAGLQFAYHNHAFEFVPVEGQIPYDILLKECDPGLVRMQMDIYWIAVGGKDPLEYFRRYPGRFPLVHVKDLKWNRAEPVPPGTATHGVAPSDERPSPEMTEAGSGEIDWKRIFEQSDLAGIEHTIVEHDRPSSAFDSIKTSYRYLSGLRF